MENAASRVVDHIQEEHSDGDETPVEDESLTAFCDAGAELEEAHQAFHDGAQDLSFTSDISILVDAAEQISELANGPALAEQALDLAKGLSISAAEGSTGIFGTEPYISSAFAVFREIELRCE